MANAYKGDFFLVSNQISYPYACCIKTEHFSDTINSYIIDYKLFIYVAYSWQLFFIRYP